MDIYGIIYMTINNLNDKKYIGQHTNLNDNYLGSGTLLQRAIKKYGENNFNRIILDYAFSQQELDIKEKCWISFYHATTREDFYNIHEGGTGGNTWAGKSDLEKLSFRIRMSKLTKGINNGMYGKKHTEETKRKISINRLIKDYPYFHSEEFKIKMSKVTSGRLNGMYGKKHKDKSKILMSINSKGKTLGSKNGMYNKKGEQAINGKKVYQYLDPNKNNLINTFNTVGCALKYLGVVGHSGLNKAIKNNKRYRGYYWSK
ncbi:GIY-YIG nuclease family protein [Clostridium perfringens]|jgi:hypothetical protein|uniref:NUMOD3 domain-containing DNA-binding protein n=1 Tax=Clostridium perfringens TaxID=1502 RepID=UPI0018E43F43|nr:NUMOD3 domain-containing DNA-binding protein [Clostridium perfringens]MBI6005961.1 GIY-YIG nuclease family protein [Clostridium perfringens]